MAHILIVEDDRVTSTILARALERAGHQTDVANDGKQAIERLKLEEVSVLVTDMNMPELNGQQLCERVRSDPRYAELPILLTTGSVDEEQLGWVEEMSGIEIVPKPIQLAHLIDRIQELTGEPEARIRTTGN